MQASKILAGAGAAVLCAGLLAGSARSEVTASGSSETNLLPLSMELRHQSLPGFPPVTSVIASASTNKFSFLVPPGFRVDGANSKRITLLSTNEITFMTMQLRRSLPEPAGDAAKKTKKKTLSQRCRELLVSEWPGEKILSEFPRTVDGCEGVGFDVQWSIVESSIQSARVVFVPTAAGMLEFRLKSTPDQFRKSTYEFNYVLLTFRESKGGKLEMVQLSNKL